MNLIIELESGVWYAPWVGDPGRTLNRANAKRFRSIHIAKVALSSARTYKPYKNAKIYPESEGS